uniref:glycosyltransferase n=1 Tax=Acetatifactor sp. TaxID=1872090 RepID=UPI004057BD07
MATYNGETYLVEQLDTIRKQSVPVDELIICDDCSKDKTVEIARNYIVENGLADKWKVVINEKNMGYANNFHNATLLATGDLILFADQDDLWREDKVQIMTALMQKHTDCMVLCSDYEPFYDGEHVPTASKKTLEKMPNNGVLEKVELSEQSVYIGALGCCMCVRREFYHKLNAYWFDGWAQDDRMWRLAQCAGGCYILHSNLIQHRIHGNNTSTYGKYHTTERRLQLFWAMQKANYAMKDMLDDYSAEKKIRLMIDKHICMMNNRIELLEQRNLLKSLQLLPFLKYYQELKSFLVEIYMVLMKK